MVLIETYLRGTKIIISIAKEKELIFKIGQEDSLVSLARKLETFILIGGLVSMKVKSEAMKEYLEGIEGPGNKIKSSYFSRSQGSFIL